MSTTALLLLIAAMAVLGYWLGKYRSLALVGGSRGIRQLHSLPRYYGMLTALWCATPGLAVLVIWVAPSRRVWSRPGAPRSLGASGPQDSMQLGLLMNDMRNLVAGNVTPEQVAEPGVRGHRRASTSVCAASRAWR